jgi:glycosyltransferase involved in cell wall biosynthesis
VGTIADDLVSLATGVVTDLGDPATGVAPGLVLPATLAGHRVDADAHADLVFTLGLLREAGVGTIGAVDVEEHLHARLAALDAARTHTFFSYRVAETVARLGGLDALAPGTRRVVVDAVDSREWLPLLDEGVLPRNYAVVLTRCELGRAALGLDVDGAAVDALLDRVRVLFGESPEGWLDDSHDGRGQVDMYTVDAVLFAAPFGDRLGAVWDRALLSAARLVDAVVTPGGAALPWGRSIGALAVCHSAELAALVLRRAALSAAADEPPAAPVPDAGAAAKWWEVARAAATGAAGWFDGGLVVSHKRRAPFRYRGSFRRLQMTLDCAGKLVAAALELRGAGPQPDTAPDAGRAPADRAVDGRPEALSPPPAGPPDAFGPRDEWLPFGDRIGVWAHRDPRMPFALAVVGGPGADYAPAPRHPAALEVPTDSPLACFVPLAWKGETRFAPAGRADALEHRPGALDLAHADFRATGAPLGEEAATLPARRRARYEVDGRTLTVHERLTFFDRPPGALAVLVPELPSQPLHVDADGEAVARVTTVDVDGLAEWRAVTGEIARVHQVELVPADEMAFRWSVTRRLRVVSSSSGHDAYHRCLYATLGERVAVRPVPYDLLDDPGRLASALATADVLHLHWPEWMVGLSASRSRRVAAAVRDAGVPVVWTQHNLAPHAAPDNEALYRPWAETAAGVIHHSRWGEQAVRERYDFAASARHRVIPHGHWGPLMPVPGSVDRAAAEAELGLSPAGLRIGVVGAPRPGKDTQLVIDGVHASSRTDVQLLVLSGDGEDDRGDPRITVVPHEEVPRAAYDRRLATIDVLALPLEGATYLTTGQVADAVGAGLPALVSPWPYLAETLGDVAVPYGRTAADLAATIDGLGGPDGATLSRARDAAVARRQALDWADLAEQTYALLDEVAATHPRL